MSGKLTHLSNLEGLNTMGWSIPFKQLLSPKREIHPYIFLQDKLFESADQKYACLFYTITEMRMGSYYGLIGIFENKQRPVLIVNPFNQWFDYEYDRAVFFYDDHILVRKEIYFEQDKQYSGTPFVVFDLKNKVFGFIHFDPPTNQALQSSLKT